MVEHHVGATKKTDVNRELTNCNKMLIKKKKKKGRIMGRDGYCYTCIELRCELHVRCSRSHETKRTHNQCHAHITSRIGAVS